MGKEKKDKRKISFLKLFNTMFVINSVTFGGGYTIIPVIKDAFVDRFEAIDDDKMTKIVSLAQSVPGAMAISTSFLVGYYTLGPVGAIVATFASVLPCLILIMVIAFSYSKLITNIYIRNALSGISGSIVALLIITIIGLIKKNWNSPKKYFYFLISILAFIAKYIFNIQVIYILIVAGIFGYWYNRGEE